MRCLVPLWDVASQKVTAKCGPLTLRHNHERKQICFLYNLLLGSNVLLATESGLRHRPSILSAPSESVGKAHVGSVSHLGKPHCTPDLVLSPTLSPSPGTDVTLAQPSPALGLVLFTPFKQACISQSPIQRRLHLEAQAVFELKI